MPVCSTSKCHCPRGVDQGDWNDWRWQVANSLYGADDMLLLSARGCSTDSSMSAVIERYPFRVSPYYLSLADAEDPENSVTKQFLPDVRELEDATACMADPFDECASTQVPGVVQRYSDRVLVMVNGECVVRCRHCTRKNTLTGELSDIRDRWPETLAFLKSSSSVREVIFSGGDPLLCDSGVLDRILGEVSAIPHVEVLRIGTRVPVVLPMRLDEDMCNMLAAHRPLWLNTQFNHPSELTDAAMEACNRLIARGIPVSNQCVLLKGINDDAETLVALCNKLQANMIRPYYVFLCDPVAGVSHLRTSRETAQRLASELRNMLSGLAMPLFVADVPGAGCKVPL
ncbi:MAG: KamA family radical SAM protein [Kiritimatiellia bacterium]|nr:KamA family radical SAM protein [Kiritimatiellia bacterium]